MRNLPLRGVKVVSLKNDEKNMYFDISYISSEYYGKVIYNLGHSYVE